MCSPAYFTCRKIGFFAPSMRWGTVPSRCIADGQLFVPTVPKMTTSIFSVNFQDGKMETGGYIALDKDTSCAPRCKDV